MVLSVPGVKILQHGPVPLWHHGRDMGIVPA